VNVVTGINCIIIALDPNGRAMMKRDMDLIRTILLQIEARKDLALKAVEIEGVDPVVLGRHVEWLYNEKLIDGPSPRQSGRGGQPHIVIKDLSWSGHDFLDAIRNDGIWHQIKQTLDVSTMPAEVIKSVGIGLLTAWARQQVGI
jgi:hypothetical protein